MPLPAEVTAWANRVACDPTARHAIVADLTRRGQRSDRSADTAEDCMQDALAAVLGRGDQARLPSFREYDHFRCYVIRSAINRGRELYRSRRRVFQQWDGSDIASPPAGEPVELLRSAVEQLPPGERQVIDLYYFEGLTLDEVADRVLPPDDRTTNARRLDTYKVRRAAEDHLRTMLTDGTNDE